MTRERIVLLIGHLTFIGLLVLSIEHYLLRCIHVDSAFQLFKWIQLDGIQIEAHRYPAVLPQLCVKLLMALGGDLKTLMIVASISHVLVAYGIFAICAYVYRSVPGALAVAIAAVLCNRLSFYGMVLEANYLLSFPFLYFGYLMRPKGKSRSLIILFMLMLASFLVHPVGAVIILFGTIILYASEQLDQQLAIKVVTICAGWMLLGRILFAPSSYEVGIYSNLMNAISGANSGSQWASWEFLVDHTFHSTFSYLPALCLVLFLFSYLIWKKKWMQSFTFIGVTIAFTALIILTYHKGEDAVMMGKNFVPLGTLIALPVSMVLLSEKRIYSIIGITIIGLIIFVKVRDISFASRGLGERLSTIEDMVRIARTNDKKKCYLKYPSSSLDRVGVLWALSYETLLCSSIKGPENSITLTIDYPELTMIQGFSFLPLLDELPSQDLNPEYFSVPQGPYTELEVP